MKRNNYDSVPPETKQNNLSLFSGFWKVFGILGTFLVGVILFWLGANILIYDLARVKASNGVIAYLLIIPLVMGAVLSWMSFSQVLKIIRREDI